jgi:hypothetical protein
MAGDTFIALAVSLPKAYFPDGDDACCVAGREICVRLEHHLIGRGHVVDETVRGGLKEEWGLSFESRCGAETFCYDVYYVEHSLQTRDDQLEMAIRYYPKPPARTEPGWLERWYSKPAFEWLPIHHPLHDVMRTFGESLDWSRMLTREELGEIEGVEYA